MLSFTADFHLLSTFNSGPPIATDTMFEVTLVVSVVQVVDMLGNTLEDSQVFGSLGTDTVVLTIQVAFKVIRVVKEGRRRVFVVLAVIRDDIVFGILAFKRREFAQKAAIARRTTATFGRIRQASAPVDTKRDAFQRFCVGIIIRTECGGLVLALGPSIEVGIGESSITITSVLLHAIVGESRTHSSMKAMGIATSIKLTFHVGVVFRVDDVFRGYSKLTLETFPCCTAVTSSVNILSAATLIDAK